MEPSGLADAAPAFAALQSDALGAAKSVAGEMGALDAALGHPQVQSAVATALLRLLGDLDLVHGVIGEMSSGLGATGQAYAQNDQRSAAAYDGARTSLGPRHAP